MSRAPLEQAESTARQIALHLDQAMPKGFGFILWIMSFGAEGVGTYISSLNRDDAIRSIQEWIARVKGDPRTQGTEFVDATTPECWCCGDKKAELVTLRGPHRSVDVCRVCLATQGRS